MGDVAERQFVLGLGGTVDYELQWDSAVLQRLATHHRVLRCELTADAPISDERSLVVAVLALVDAGAGAERFVLSSKVIRAFSAHFDYAVTLGGTGVRAGLVMDSLGIPSVQHLVSIDENVRRLLPSRVSFICSAIADSLDPHLIVQYPAGARIRLSDGEVVSSDANRLIFANDPPNREMRLAPELGKTLANASVFLVSGFNTMQDRALLEQRLEELRRAMATLPDDALVYYEDAGFYTRAFAETVRARLLSEIDVYSLNEDELQEYVGRRVDLLNSAEVSRALAEIRVIIPVPVLVVHTRYWALAVGTDAARHRTALESAVRVAATRFRLGDGCTAAQVAETAGMPRHVDGAHVVDAVEAAMADAVGVPAFDLAVDNPTTIGLGDTFVGGFLAGHVSKESII